MNIFAAWCSVPILTHGFISDISSDLFPNCPNQECFLGTKISISCEPEYHLSGNEQVSCVGYGEWEPSFPICEGKPKCIALVARKEST